MAGYLKAPDMALAEEQEAVYLEEEGEGGDVQYLEDEEEEEEEEEAEGEEEVEIPEGYIEYPEFATSPDNPNRDIVPEGDWEIAIGNWPYLGLSNRDVIWILAQLHILFASFILGVPMFIIIAEIMAWKTGDERYERLAKETTKVVVMCYSFTAIFGTAFLLVLVAFYPSFTTWLFRGFNNLITFWYPLLILVETTLMYMYYYMWDPLNRSNRKGLHIIIGLLLNVAGVSLLILLDAPATFMLTPTKVEGTLRGIAGFGEWAWVWNFSWWPLNIHRLIGNLTFGGYIVGLIGAYMFMMSKDAEEKAYYDWQGYIGNTLGVGFMLPLPFAGYLYAYELYQYDAAIGMYIMSDRISMFMLVQAILIGFLFIGSAYYIWISTKRIEGSPIYLKLMRVTFVIMFFCAAIWFAPRHFFATMILEPGMVPEGMTEADYLATTELPGTLAFLALMKAKNTAAFTLIGCVLFNYILYRIALKRGRIVYGEIDPVSQYVLVFLAFSDVWLMGLMGSIRELSRKNYHVYRVFKDMTPDAYTPTLAHGAVLITAAAWIFFIILSFVIWMQLYYGKPQKAHAAE
jgi:cytochrome bd-type quinol oxidase subunit 1